MNESLVSNINKFCIIQNMKNYNNSNPSLEIFRGNQFSAKETVETIQNISKNIRDYSHMMRETMKTLRQSGAIPEMAEAIREGSFAVRDTVKDINETTQELKNNGVVVDAASAVEYALKSAERSLATAKEITTDVGKASPNTTKAIQQGIDRVKKQTNQAAKKIGESNWRV